jgi:hypothetical protein
VDHFLRKHIKRIHTNVEDIDVANTEETGDANTFNNNEKRIKGKRRITKQRLREAEITYIQEQIKSSKGDSNCIWKTIRQCLPSGDSNRPTYTRDATVVVEEFNDFFTTVGMKSAQLAKDITQKFELPPVIGNLGLDYSTVDDNMFQLRQVTTDKTGMDLLGGAGGRCSPPPPSHGQGVQGVQFFMIKQKIIRDKMIFSNLSNNMMISEL